MNTVPRESGFPGSDATTDSSAQNPGRAIANQKRKAEIQLKMLTWFLSEHLSKCLPELFSQKAPVKPHGEQGVSNFTLTSQTDSGQQVIIRMKQKPEQYEDARRSWSDYHKEGWISERLSGEVPVPKLFCEGIEYIHGNGRSHEYAIIIQEHIPFPSASKVTDLLKREALYEQIGDLCRKINQIKTPGYGSFFIPGKEQFEFSTWNELLLMELRACRLSHLTNRETISFETARNIESVVDQLFKLDVQPTLYHSDFSNNWGNILISADGTIQSVIDWEYAASGFGKAAEIAVTKYVFIRNGLAWGDYKNEFLAFLRGYQIDFVEYRHELQDIVDAFMLLHATKKLVRYEGLKDSGQLNAPWQIAFSKRAQSLVTSLSKKLA